MIFFSLEVVNLRVSGEAEVAIGIINGISLRSLEVDLSIHAIQVI
jgi:hypothetical protein